MDNQDNAFVIFAYNEIDTVISGFESAKHAYNHRESLKNELEISGADIKIIAIVGDAEKVRDCIFHIENMVAENKRIGRKTMLSLATQFGVAVKPAQFVIKVTIK